MQTHTGENGVVQEWQRIEQEIDSQRSSLHEVGERLEEWESSWSSRQQDIDASLAQLKSRLGTPGVPFKSTPLKIFVADESAE